MGGWNGVRVVKQQHHHHHHWIISATPPLMYHTQLDSIQLSPAQTIPNSSLVYQPQQRQRQRAMSSAISRKIFLLCRHNNWQHRWWQHRWWQHRWWHGWWQLTPCNLVIITLFVFVPYSFLFVFVRSTLDYPKRELTKPVFVSWLERKDYWVVECTLTPYY